MRKTKKTTKLKVYQDKSGRWRWSFIAPNGRIIADSSEGYSSKRNVLKAFDTLILYVFELNSVLDDK